MCGFHKVVLPSAILAVCTTSFFGCRQNETGFETSGDTEQVTDEWHDPFAVESVLPTSCEGPVEGLGYRLIDLSEAALDRIVAETPEMMKYGMGIRDIESRRYDYYTAAWQLATNALETATLTPEERANGRAVAEWHKGRVASTEARHAQAETAWENHWYRFESVHWLRHALHCIFPPAATMQQWKRVRNASGVFAGDIPFAFTNGFARLPFARNEVRKEWDCNDLEPYVVVFRTEPDWCLAETADADLIAYEEDLEECVVLHDWKKLHIAVVRDGHVTLDIRFGSGGNFVDGFSLGKDGKLVLPERERVKLAEAGFTNGVGLPSSLLP